MKGPLPVCRMSRDFWRRVTAELDRVKPLEGVAVPLVALEPRRHDFNPCSIMSLQDIRAVTLAAAVLVPGRLQVNERLRVHVTSGTDRPVNCAVRKLVARFPRLRTGALLHSHPFARGTTFPSRGPAGDYEGHMLPLLERNREGGLETSFSFIACRESRGPGWKLEAFALDGDERIVALGAVEEVEDTHPAVRAALVPGPRRGSPAHQLAAAWSRRLRRRDRRHDLDELLGGWLRLVVRPAPSRAIVTLIPPDHPSGALQSYVICTMCRKSRRIGSTDPLAAHLVAPPCCPATADRLALHHPESEPGSLPGPLPPRVPGSEPGWVSRK